MSALSESTGALLPYRHPPQGLQFGPFPDNMAVGLLPNFPGKQPGGSESSWHRTYFSLAHTRPVPPQREGVATQLLAANRDLGETSNTQLESALTQLKTRYIFRNESAITHFILSHRAIAAVLTNAVPELVKSFGEDVVFTLEVVTDEDASTFLYAIVVWRGSAIAAATALDDFDERWWLSQPAQTGLTFTYELA
jgi:hypothetical protein